MHNVVKWPNILSKSWGVNTARFLKYVWPFYNMHERVKVVDLLDEPYQLRDCLQISFLSTLLPKNPAVNHYTLIMGFGKQVRIYSIYFKVILHLF